MIMKCPKYEKRLDEAFFGGRLFDPSWSGSFAYLIVGSSIETEACLYCKKHFKLGDKVIRIRSLKNEELLERDVRSAISCHNSIFCPGCFAELAMKIALGEEPQCEAIEFEEKYYYPDGYCNNPNYKNLLFDVQKRIILSSQMMEKDENDNLKDKSIFWDKDESITKAKTNREKAEQVIIFISNITIFCGSLLIVYELIKAIFNIH